MQEQFYEQVKESADYIRERLGYVPDAGIILGSGLGDFVSRIENPVTISYSDIPHFPVPKVKGHSGNLICGRIGNCRIAGFEGRVHYYEGYTMKEVAYNVFTMGVMGIPAMIVTNACGGINRSFTPGDLMIQTDFLNLTGVNPLIGDNDERLGTRFPDMTEPYDPELRQKTLDAAKKLGIDLKEGVFALFPGPYFETKAEIRAFAVMGADAIGMSTVPEVIAANYLGMKVLGISCITNMATGISPVKHSHEEVIRTANESSEKLGALLLEVMKKW